MAIRIGKGLFLSVLELGAYLAESGTVVLNVIHVWTCPIVLECIFGGQTSVPYWWYNAGSALIPSQGFLGTSFVLSRGFDTTTDVKPTSARKAEDSIMGEKMENVIGGI